MEEAKEVILLLLLLHPDDVQTREPGLRLTDSGQVRLLVSPGKLELSHILSSCAFSKLKHCCCQIGLYGVLLV